jgi:hypothetical protein
MSEQLVSWGYVVFVSTASLPGEVGDGAARNVSAEDCPSE